MASSKLPAVAIRKLDEACRLIDEERHDEALRILNDLLNEYPDDPTVLHTVGVLYIRAERHGMAYVFNCRARDYGMSLPGVAKDQLSALWNNVALCAAAIPGKTDEAHQAVRKALKLHPENYAALNNLALWCVNETQPEEAIKWADKSLAIKPGQREVEETRGYACLMLQRWAEGWHGYERMVGGKHRKPKPLGNEPYWKGETGVRLLVRGEQGIGDEISFASMLPDAMKDNGLVFECDKRLEGLFKRSFPNLPIQGTRFQKHRGWSADVDAHCLVGSLATKYRLKNEDFPGTPYLIADQERRDQWKLVLDRLPGKKIGIAWTGGLQNTFRHRRSASLEDLLPILKTPGCSFVSLQYQDPSDEIESLYQKHGIRVHHYARATEAPNYDETAALVAELDLVITVTTAVVDLCGAMGKECWVLVPAKPHWRYGLKGDRKVWYRSVKLYRAKKALTDCVEQIRGDLASYLHRSGQPATAGLHGSTVVDHRPFQSPRFDYTFASVATSSEAPRVDGVHVHPLPAPVPDGLPRNRFIP